MQQTSSNKLLIPLGWLYGLIITFRNLFYDFKIFKVKKYPVPIISVGNLTAGGTGKTPFVEFLIRYYQEFGIKVCVISRGYKRSSTGLKLVSDGVAIYGSGIENGDEPQQIAEKFPNVIVIVDEKRVRAVEFALERFHPSIILMDDAFQHRAVNRDLDIIMADGRLNLLKIPMIPAGTRREPLSALRRADLIVFTNVTATSQTALNSLRKYTTVPTVGIKYEIERVWPCADQTAISITDLVGAECVVFCGIGNPAGFRQTLSELKVKIMEFALFPDHHVYMSEELQNIKKYFEIRKAKYIITTEKDTMRLKSMKRDEHFPWQKCYYLEVGVTFISGESLLRYTLKEKIDSRFT
ncbi:MAG: tetraacyldisaccharide 4'-kinase [Ignavibacteriales bacterium]|nr:tetraacyldisaccharide 4'-kinase [Ignavibacteriales bacterium]